MTEAELIARLRMMPTYSGDPKGPHWLPNQAADRIEAMIAERDALFRRATLAEEWRDHDKTRAEAAEAKLAKAVAELERLGFDFDSNLGRELKPITEWPEETGNIMVGELKLQSSEFATQKGETHE